jgi:hypothetical protein
MAINPLEIMNINNVGSANSKKVKCGEIILNFP